MADRMCTVVEDDKICTRRHYARGMCTKHYQRWQHHGDPLFRREMSVGCSIEGCERQHYGHGYCHAHWARWWMNGDPLPDVAIGEWKPVAVKDPEYAAYVARHRRVRRARGKAAEYSCEHCGRQAAQWAQIHGTDGEKPDDYKPLCARCHSAYDGTMEKIRPLRILKGLSPAGVERMREIRRKQWASYSEAEKAAVIARLSEAAARKRRSGVIKDGQQVHADGGPTRGSSEVR